MPQDKNFGAIFISPKNNEGWKDGFYYEKIIRFSIRTYDFDVSL